MPTNNQLFKNELSQKEIIAGIEMRYSLLNDTSHLVLSNYSLANFTEFKNIDKDLQFATAVAMFALKIKQSKYIKLVNWADIQKIAFESYNQSSYLQSEFLQLITKAQEIYNPKKQRKNRKD